MNSNDERRLITAFADGELELGRRLEIEDRMRSDAGLAHEVESLGHLREAIRAGADYHAAPAALRERLRSSTAPVREREPTSPSSPIGAAVRRWLDWRPLVASAGLVTVLVAVVGTTWLRPSPDDLMRDDVIASHVRSTLGEHLVDVASSDHHTVKPWLSSKLDFSPPVGELPIPGSTFVGGRVDYIGGRPVAALVYRQGAHVVNAFVWPSSARAEVPVFSEERGYRMAHWTGQGMAHWVISDVDRKEFGIVVDAVRAAGSDAGARP